VLRDADVVVYLLDGKAGLSPADPQVARRIRALGLPVVFAVNKIDRPEHQARMIDFLELGESDLIAVSAAHGQGFEELWERIRSLAGLGPVGSPEAVEEDGEEGEGERGEEAAAGQEDAEAALAKHGRDGIRFAFIGRPNVGKSSLLNALAGFERVLVDPTPGTTRDAIDVALTRGDRRYTVVDTAGLRRKSKIVAPLESRAAGASLEALDRAEVVVLVLESDAVLTDQDLRLADLVWRHGRGLVIAINKSDLSPRLKVEACRETVARALRQWPPLPVVLVSAKRKRGLDELLRGVDRVGAAFRRRLPTARVNEAVQRAAAAVPPPLASGRTVKLMYATQTASGPPTVVVFASQGGILADSYRRYLTHRLREEFDLTGVPLRLQVRARPRRALQGAAREEPRRASRGRPPAAKKPDGKARRKRVRR
jgi:GTP-binding protein